MRHFIFQTPDQVGGDGPSVAAGGDGYVIAGVTGNPGPRSEPRVTVDPSRHDEVPGQVSSYVCILLTNAPLFLMIFCDIRPMKNFILLLCAFCASKILSLFEYFDIILYFCYVKTNVVSKLLRHILDYATTHPTFLVTELLSATPEYLLSSRSTLEWHLWRLTKEGKLSHIGKGQYSSQPHPAFIPSADETDSQLFNLLKSEYPEATFCVYKGSVFTTLQHHLSFNALTYIETQRELTETIFHRFQEEGRNVFHRPDKKVFYDYIDIAKRGFIIKPLITGSPLQECSGVTVPRLEKLLVDIRCDADFDYMSGSESSKMLNNAASLYTFNKTKLLRYAGRRHCRELFEAEFNQLGL